MDNFMEYGWEDEIVNEGGEFVLLPEGDYDFTVAKYERARTSSCATSLSGSSQHFSWLSV